MDRELIAPYRQISDSDSLYVLLKDHDREDYNDSPPRGVPRRAKAGKQGKRAGDSVAQTAHRRVGDMIGGR
jgi:hypothetical protein